VIEGERWLAIEMVHTPSDTVHVDISKPPNFIR
jgi:hypothetical protein